MVFCINCGKHLDDSFSFCPSCGSNQHIQGIEKNKEIVSDTQNKIVDEEEDEEIEEYHDIETKSKLLRTKSKYLGGHSMHPAKKEIKTKIIMRNDHLFIEKITLSVPYSQMKSIENMDDKKISKLRVIGLGLIFLPLAIVGALWKKKKLYTVIEYNDGIQEQTVVIDFGKNVEKMQQAIYAKMIESKSKKYSSQL